MTRDLFRRLKRWWIIHKAIHARKRIARRNKIREFWRKMKSHSNRIHAERLKKRYSLFEELFTLHTGWFEIFILRDGCDPEPLYFNDVDFKKKLKNMRKKCDDYIQHSGQTNPVEESGKVQEQILR